MLSRLCDPDLKDKIENEKLVSACQKAAFKTKAPHHELYRKNFNAEDLANKRWYKTEGTDPAPVWTSKFVWGLLRQCVMNAFTIVKESGSVLTYAEFRREAAEEVLQGIPNVSSKRGKKKGNDSGSTSKQMGKGKRVEIEFFSRTKWESN